MLFKISYILYYSSLLFAAICCVYRYKILDSASKVIAILICCGFLNELAAYYLSIVYHNNLRLFAIYCFLEFSLTCLYFNKVIDVFIEKNVGLIIMAIGLVFGIANLVFIQHLNSINFYFLFFEGLTVIGMSLFAFFRFLLNQENLDLYKFPHFWFISILVFFWSVTFLFWGLYDYINLKFKSMAWGVNFTLPFIGVITYLSLGWVFLSYKKMLKSP
jgi:hypothetical protein